MDVPKPEELPQSPYDDEKVSRDSYLSPTFFSHAEECSAATHPVEIAYRSGDLT